MTGYVQFDVLYTYLYLNREFYMTIKFIKREQVKNENPVYYNVEVVIWVMEQMKASFKLC